MTHTHVVDSERCKGCGLCVHFCPKSVLEITDRVNAKGHFPVYQARPEDCIHCTICCIMCPDVAISIVESETQTA